MQWKSPTKALTVIKLLVGAHNLKPASDVRLPIMPTVQEKLINATYHVFFSPFKGSMIRTMMVLAFRAYLRVGEMVPHDKSVWQGCLQLGDVEITDGIVVVHFKQFKHSGNQGAQTLCLKPGYIDKTNIDANRYIEEFIQERGNYTAPFFAYPDGSPFLRRKFYTAFKLILSFCGLNSMQFKGHSFRICAAVQQLTESDAQIRTAGRWPSDAFKSYILELRTV